MNTSTLFKLSKMRRQAPHVRAKKKHIVRLQLAWFDPFVPEEWYRLSSTERRYILTFKFLEQDRRWLW